MSSQGPNSGSAAVNTPITGVAWDSPENVLASDDAYASATVGDPVSVTDALDVTGFGFSLPTGTTVVGVLVEIEVIEAGGEIKTHTVQLLAGSAIGDNLSDAGEWPAGEDVLAFGDTDNLWGATLTPALVNASDFGVRLRADVIDPDAVALIDHVRITVFYTAASGAKARTLLGVG